MKNLSYVLIVCLRKYIIQGKLSEKLNLSTRRIKYWIELMDLRF